MECNVPKGSMKCLKCKKKVHTFVRQKKKWIGKPWCRREKKSCDSLTLRFSKFLILCSIITRTCRIGDELSATSALELEDCCFSILALEAEGILYQATTQTGIFFLLKKISHTLFSFLFFFFDLTEWRDSMWMKLVANQWIFNGKWAGKMCAPEKKTSFPAAYSHGAELNAFNVRCSNRLKILISCRVA